MEDGKREEGIPSTLAVRCIRRKLGKKQTV